MPASLEQYLVAIAARQQGTPLTPLPKAIAAVQARTENYTHDGYFYTD